MAVKEGWLGRFYEDFEIGDIFVHPQGRTITDADNVWFALLACNTHQVHYNQHYASKTEYGRCLVNSGLTLAVIAGMSVSDVSENAVANLSWEHINLPNPVFAGDTLYAESAILGKRESKSRPNAGIVRIKTRGYNQNGVSIMEFIRNALIYKKGMSPRSEITEWRYNLAASRPSETDA